MYERRRTYCSRSHNPKVAGSNPAPATNEAGQRPSPESRGGPLPCGVNVLSADLKPGTRGDSGLVPQGFRDHATGSTWDVLGNATAGPLAGARLTPVEHVDTFWFAWAAFLPETRVADV